MYIKEYKLNHSYTTYVVIETEEDEPRVKECSTNMHVKPLKWARGSKVNHSFHGKGVICEIGNNEVKVRFEKSKLFPKIKSFVVTFNYLTKPNEIGNLTLCY